MSPFACSTASAPARRPKCSERPSGVRCCRAALGQLIAQRFENALRELPARRDVARHRGRMRVDELRDDR